MDPRPEIFYMQTPETTVSNTRAILNGVTYAMANVTSVRMHTIPPGGGWFIIVLIGIAGVLLGIAQGLWFVLLIGAVFLGLGFWAKSQVRPTYVVALGTAGGEAHAQQSQDRELIASIVDAVSKAIVERG